MRVRVGVVVVAAVFVATIRAGHAAPPEVNSERIKTNSIVPSSQPQSFWYGDEVPSPEGQAIHDALTTPDGGPIRALMNKLEQEDLNPECLGGLQQSKPEKAYPGYTLISSLVLGAILIDMDGNVVEINGKKKTWRVQAFPAKFLPDGSILGFRGTGRPDYGDYNRLVQLDWCDNSPIPDPTKELWHTTATDPANTTWGIRGHHDFQRQGFTAGYYTPSDNPILDGSEAKHWVLVHREPPLASTLNVSDLLGLEDDSILELEPDGTVGWQWNAYEHVEQMGFSAVAREAIRTIRVSTYGGRGGGGGGPPETDWQHLNAVSLLGPNKWYAAGDERFHPDNIMWDGRSSNIIAIIARHDDPQGRWASGDIVWQAGPEYTDNKGKGRIGQIIGQHTAHMIPEGLPGAGNILVYDNGGLAGFGSLLPGLPAFWPVTFRSYSRAIEFDPVSMEKVWEYKNETDKRALGGERKFFSWFISSVQRLPNGNTLIAEGMDARVFEVTEEGEVVWEYYGGCSTFPNPPNPPIKFSNMIYRAYRYPADYLPLSKACP